MAFTASVISTKEWDARPPRQWAGETRPQYIIIHHTATPNPPNDVSRGTLTGAKTFTRSIQTAHVDGFGWIDSGHNFLNTTGGYLLEGRHGSLTAAKQGRSVRSSHAGSNKGNQSPGIENEGTFITYQMNAKQWDSLVELCASICSTTKINPDNILGHRDFSPTQCPGDWLYSQLPRLRQEVRQRLGASFIEVLREGDTGLRVKELQQILSAQGFNPGPIDGIFGAGTEDAVVLFQKFYGLEPDGLVGPNTWKVLERVSQPTQPPPIDTGTPTAPDTTPGGSKPLNPQTPFTQVQLLDTYRYYRELPHQTQAIQWLQAQLSEATLVEFSQKWRNQPLEPFLPLQEGSVGSQVKQVQEVLQQEGFDPGPADGIYGAKTKAAVIAFQRSKGMTADGIVGAVTWSVLNLV
ncbi:Putative peptidoglycan binding domain protein [Coleofasciculus chthonoplastes PCC 7420]|uniref:Putative peptidoglycan binding domain protein n=1 Tax=Coleofasciculus chthonoplastes PCC 7420 TaxID=118168 RepID=B4VXL7_9CYAN|nr:N-acetylmuramoyl-L-alanine amidase [Coleofasciculus chthonoplastes]EDX73364.1 Putative peptidoglycan binding domain protein [Coleofasciculus chthonoplastes PCC 7420]